MPTAKPLTLACFGCGSAPRLTRSWPPAPGPLPHRRRRRPGRRAGREGPAAGRHAGLPRLSRRRIPAGGRQAGGRAGDRHPGRTRITSTAREALQSGLRRAAGEADRHAGRAGPGDRTVGAAGRPPRDGLLRPAVRRVLPEGQGDHRLGRVGRNRLDPGQRGRDALAPGAFVRPRALGGGGEEFADDPVEMLPRHGHRALAGGPAVPADRQLWRAGFLPARAGPGRRPAPLHGRLPRGRHLPVQRRAVRGGHAVPLAADGLRSAQEATVDEIPAGCRPVPGAAASIAATTTPWTGRCWRWSSPAA